MMAHSSIASTLNTSEPKESQELTWNKDLNVKEIPPEDEPMDSNLVDPSSVDSVEELAKKFRNEDLSDLKFLSESEWAKMLQLVINYQKEKQIDLNDDMIQVLNVIFSASFEDLIILNYLKDFKIEDILAAVHIILKYMKRSVNMPEDALQKPTDLQIVNWMALVIFSQTETLLFTKDKTIQRLMKNVKRALLLKIYEFEDLDALQNYLVVCCSKKNYLPKQCPVEKYHVETLDV